MGGTGEETPKRGAGFAELWKIVFREGENRRQTLNSACCTCTGERELTSKWAKCLKSKVAVREVTSARSGKKKREKYKRFTKNQKRELTPYRLSGENHRTEQNKNSSVWLGIDKE